MLLLLGVRMRIIEIIVITLLLFLVVYLACFYGRNESKVYACHEVIKSDPKDVQDMCKKLRRNYE